MMTKMMYSLKKNIYNLPCPINLNYWWNMGSLLGVILCVQLISGLVLSCHYTASASEAYDSIVHIMHNVQLGWLFRSVHMNGASFFFILIYAHIGRGIYYNSFTMKKVWNVGVVMYFLLMMISFLGYVLPWGQMSYWGATVITNLLTAIPMVGEDFTKLVWGGFTVGDSTLKRFYILHLFTPFILSGMVGVHMYFLHISGSNNPLGIDDSGDLISFHPYYTFKDFVGVVGLMSALFGVVFLYPTVFESPENYVKANPFKTPMHIQPEWYFLAAYTILRSCHTKGGGVAAMLGSSAVLFVLPYWYKPIHLGFSFYPVSQVHFWSMVASWGGLTYLGTCPVQYPYFEVGRILSFNFFSFFFSMGLLELYWDKVTSCLTYKSTVKGNGMTVVSKFMGWNGATNKSNFPLEPGCDPHTDMDKMNKKKLWIKSGTQLKGGL
nr:CYTB [Donax vittatus]